MARRKPAIDVLSLRNVVSRMAHCVGAGADTWFRGTETRRVERGRAGCVECDFCASCRLVNCCSVSSCSAIFSLFTTFVWPATTYRWPASPAILTRRHALRGRRRIGVMRFWRCRLCSAPCCLARCGLAPLARCCRGRCGTRRSPYRCCHSMVFCSLFGA